MTWLPNRTGQAIDLVNPAAAQVDFREMAHALAHTNRYIGHGEIQVSVALHTLIGLDMCPEALRPKWLLHDGHEERLGDIARPTFEALAELAHLEHGAAGLAAFKGTIAEFKLRHDRVIYAAAGLAMPSEAERFAIASIDYHCLATEHRDFHRPSTRKWAHELAGVKPSRSIRKFRAPDKIADDLYVRFRHYLPALRAQADASLFEGA